MTNHAFASGQGRLTNIKLRTALEEIVAKRFPGVFNVTGEDKHGYYDIEVVKPRRARQLFVSFSAPSQPTNG